MADQQSDRLSGSNPRGIPHQRTVSQVLWTLTNSQDRVQSCELLDESAGGNAWAIVIAIDGEPHFSRSCADIAEAEYVARALRQDAERSGWSG